MALFNKNDFFTKVKDSAANVANKVKETAENAKNAYAEKKELEEQYKKEMNDEAARKAQEIIDSIHAYQNGQGLYDGITFEQVTAFTKEFYDKILMPANSVSQSKISMYPYITEKALQKFIQTMPEYDNSETALVYLKAEGKQELVLTDKSFYFSLALEADAKYFARGRISCSDISVLSVEQTDSEFVIKCDEYGLATFAVDKTSVEDFTTLSNYFSRLAARDFTIADEDVDALIKEKIGNKVYAEVKKYLVFDDELMVYFAWGINSLSAKDYIVCTTKQIIVVNREMLGATANIKQFYYEDITSASTEQNAKSSDFTTALLETAITAATKTCDLIISVAGATTKIDTLFKVEAERVVAVYHQYRKLSKMATVQPQVIVQQPQEDPLTQLKKLAELKEIGVISDEEFNIKKAELLTKI